MASNSMYVLTIRTYEKPVTHRQVKHFVLLLVYELNFKSHMFNGSMVCYVRIIWTVVSVSVCVERAILVEACTSFMLWLVNCIDVRL